MSNSLSSPMTITIKHLLVGFIALWSTCGIASGWNDFERDIGHGYRLSKTDSFYVCIYQLNSGVGVCGDKRKGDYGPVSGYFFTDKHLLVRTHGAKPQENSEYFETDIDREHFFIIKRKLPSRGRHSAIGPLDRDEFYNNPVVPADIQWELPTRSASNSTNENDTSLFGNIFAAFIALLAVLLVVFWQIVTWLWNILVYVFTAILWVVSAVVVFWPITISLVILFFVVRWILRRRRMKSWNNN